MFSVHKIQLWNLDRKIHYKNSSLDIQRVSQIIWLITFRVFKSNFQKNTTKGSNMTKYGTIIVITVKYHTYKLI